MSRLANKIVSVISAAVMFYAVSASATPIIYDGELQNGVPKKGAVSASGGHDESDSTLSDYWSFNATAGDTVGIEVHRLERAYDPALWIFSGVFSDSSDFGGSIDFGDTGYVDYADDEISVAGPWGDPLATFIAPVTGVYTAIVTNWASGADDGDGYFPYFIVANGLTSGASAQKTPIDVPEPGSLALIGLGLAGLGAARRKKAS